MGVMDYKYNMREHLCDVNKYFLQAILNNRHPYEVF